LLWFALAVGLWATDFIHHTNPAMIGLGAGLMLSLPRIGVLDGKAIKQTNFLAIIFSAGAVSMGNVLLETNTLPLLTKPLLGWMQPLLSNPISYTLTLYLSGFFYHFIFANRQSMLITSLPVLLVFAKSQGLDPVSLAYYGPLAEEEDSSFISPVSTLLVILMVTFRPRISSSLEWL
jgi:hypothetical protein